MTEEQTTVRTWEWTFLTMLGLAAGLIGGLLVDAAIDDIVNAMVVTAAFTCMVGAGLGSFQAFSLRRVVKRPLWWIAATAVGMGAGLAIGVVIVEQIGILLTGQRPNIARLAPAIRALSLVVVGLASGTATGLAQWLVLRRYTQRVHHWAISTGVALALAFATSSLLVDLSPLRLASAAGVVVFVVVAGMLFGAITGWRLQRAA
jgi:hypothetical protein